MRRIALITVFVVLLFAGDALAARQYMTPGGFYNEDSNGLEWMRGSGQFLNEPATASTAKPHVWYYRSGN